MVGISYKALLMTGFLISASVTAQTQNPPSVSTVIVVLSDTLDTKSAYIGQEVVLWTSADLRVRNEVIIPKGSKIIAQVAGAVTKGKDEPKSSLAIEIQKAVIGKGQEIRLQAIIVALAAPQNSLDSDPTYVLMHSNEPKMSGSAQSTASSGTLSASSKASSSAAVATAQMKGMDEPLLLNENSQGAIGYEDVAVAWHLSIPPPLTIFSTKAKNLKLLAGTQMLLRMAEPRLPK